MTTNVTILNHGPKPVIVRNGNAHPTLIEPGKFATNIAVWENANGSIEEVQPEETQTSTQ